MRCLSLDNPDLILPVSVSSKENIMSMEDKLKKKKGRQTNRQEKKDRLFIKCI